MNNFTTHIEDSAAIGQKLSPTIAFSIRYGSTNLQKENKLGASNEALQLSLHTLISKYPIFLHEVSLTSFSCLSIMIIALSLSASLLTSLLPLRTVVIMAREWQAALISGELSNCCHQLVSSQSIRISQILCNLQYMKCRQMQ